MMFTKSPINILIDPVFTAKHISRCSSFWGAAKLVNDFCLRYPETRVACLVPDASSTMFVADQDRMQETLPAMKKWQYVLARCGWDRYQNHYFPHDTLLDIVADSYGSHGDFDVLVTNRNNGQFFRRTAVFGNIQKCICMYDTFPMFSFKKTFTCPSEHGKRLSDLYALTSYLSYDAVFVEASYEKTAIMNLAKLMLSPTNAKRLDSIIHAAYQSSPLPTDYVHSDQARKLFCSSGPFNVIYAQKAQESQRRFSLVFKTLQSIFSKLAANRDIRLTLFIATTNGIRKEMRRDWKFFMTERVPREEFWEKLRQSHAQISFSVEEDMPKGILEGVLLGVIPVIAPYPWSLCLFGDAYPFFAKNEQECYATISWIDKNRTEAWDKFLHWYDSHFVPKVLPRGNASDIFESIVTNHIQQTIRAAAKRGSRDDSMFSDILRYVQSGETCNLQKVEQYSWAHDSERKTPIPDRPFSRLPRRWVQHFMLRQLHGWQPTNSPWELTRP